MQAEDAREELKGAGDVGAGQGFENHEGPRAAPGRAAFSQTQKLGPREGGSPRSHTPGSADSLFAVSCSLPQGEGGRENGGDDFKIQGPSTFECRGGNRLRGPTQTLAGALPSQGTRATSHLRASLSSSVKWE